MYAVGAYLLLVAVGLLLRPSNWKSAGGDKEAPKTEKASVLKTLFSEPIRIFQLIYNLTQVAAVCV